MGISDSGKLSHISQLMVRSIEKGYHYYQNGGPVSGKNIGSSHKADFRATVAEVSFSGGHRVAIDPEALFSVCDAATGESANVYRAEGYSEENPLYLVKGIDENGNEYEQTIDVSKVNPNHCSYRELLALNAHTGNRSDSNFLSMSVLKDKMKNTSYEVKTNYLSAAYALMKDMQTVGCWNSYMRYDKWISDILSIGQNRAFDRSREAAERLRQEIELSKCKNSEAFR